MARKVPVWTIVAAITVAGGPAAAAEEDPGVKWPAQDNPTFMVSPLFGWNEDKLHVPARGPMPGMTLTDSGEEYGLFALFRTPRIVVNDTLFFTRANGADIAGNLAYLNLYGDPASAVTWNVGAGHLWHGIEPEGSSITVSAPMAKAGVMIRLRELGLSFNPYVGYAWENVRTTYGDEDTESVLYGLAVKYNWRMLHATAKYYLEDNRDLHKGYNVLQTRFEAFINPHLGLLVMFDYMQHQTTDDTSFLFGPIWVF